MPLQILETIFFYRNSGGSYSGIDALQTYRPWIVIFEKEYKELDKLIKKLSKILESEKELLKVIKEEILEVKENSEIKGGLRL